MKRTDHIFISQGIKCAGWLYLPDGIAKPPVVVMAHGLAAERNFGLPAFAERFAADGMAAFVFDYRNFGDSEGEPRNLIDPSRHLEDWKAAVTYVKAAKEIDSSRTALWGSSFSGGHVLVTAAALPGIAAVVSQVPFVDGISTTMLFDLKYQLTGVMHGLIDIIGTKLFNRPHYVPVVADPGEFALMNTPESKPGYMALAPSDSKWKNEAPARILLTLPVYRPMSYAAKITCPVLLIYAEKDSLISPDAVLKTASKIKNVEIVGLPVGHFDIYRGEWFEKVVKMETEFLIKHLKNG